MLNHSFSCSKHAQTEDTENAIWAGWIWAWMESVYIVSVFTFSPPTDTHLNYLRFPLLLPPTDTTYVANISSLPCTFPTGSERRLALHYLTHKTVVIAHAIHFSVTRGQNPSLSVKIAPEGIASKDRLGVVRSC